MYFTIERVCMQENYINLANENCDLAAKRSELEALITANSSLIDILKDACELNIELNYISNIHSALSVISEKQIETLKLVSELK